MPEIHFTADHHFFHDGIIRMCGRPFSSTDEMNETMIERRNAVVHGNDVVYHLGDFAMKGTAEGCAAVFERIKGRKHLIVGNHDKARVTSLPWASAPQARMLVRVPGEKVPLVLDHYAMRTCRARTTAPFTSTGIRTATSPAWTGGGTAPNSAGQGKNWSRLPDGYGEGDY